MDTEAITQVIHKRKIKIGILAVPAAPARVVLDALVEGGVIAFLNLLGVHSPRLAASSSYRRKPVSRAARSPHALTPSPIAFLSD